MKIPKIEKFGFKSLVIVTAASAGAYLSRHYDLLDRLYAVMGIAPAP